MEQLELLALEAKKDERALETLIEAQKSFILRCASRAAGRFLTDSDDEWSIALMAFHEAVGAYAPDKGSFQSLAGTVIRRRVIDYLRSQQKFTNEMSVAPETLSGDLAEDPSASETEVRTAAVQQSLEGNADQSAVTATRDEIEAVQARLRDYGFSFFDLTDCSPKAGKTKEQCGRAVAVLMLLEHPPLMEKLRRTKTLPMKELSEASGVSRKTLERHRKYIIASAEILTGDFPILGEYLSYIRKTVK